MQHSTLREIALKEKELIMASLEITEKCNLSCKHCYCHEERKDLKLSDIIKILDKLYDLGVLYLTLSGGEVFAHRDFVDIYKYAKSKGFIISIFSNATIINDKIRNVLIKYKPDLVSISIYGVSNLEYLIFTGKDKFNQLKKNIDFFKKNDIKFTLKTVLTKDSIKSANAMSYEKIAKEYEMNMTYDPIIFGGKDFDGNKISNRLTVKEIVGFEQKLPDNYSFWNKEVKECHPEGCIRCGAGVSSLSLDSNGFARICSLYMLEEIDFLSSSNDEIKKFLQISHNNMQNNFLKSECSKCKDKSICKWCSAYAYLEHKDPSKKIDFFCELASERKKVFLNEN